MENNLLKPTEFFPSSNLNNMSFYLYLPSFTDEEKEIISKTIIYYKGLSKKNIYNL